MNILLFLKKVNYIIIKETQYFMYYVNEEISTTLDSEIENRKLHKNAFEAKELAMIVKIIFKGIKELKDN